jgi:hypothetical protein
LWLPNHRTLTGRVQPGRKRTNGGVMLATYAGTITSAVPLHRPLSMKSCAPCRTASSAVRPSPFA